MGCEVELASRPLALRTSFSTAHKIAIDFELPLRSWVSTPLLCFTLPSQNVAVTYVLN